MLWLEAGGGLIHSVCVLLHYSSALHVLMFLVQLWNLDYSGAGAQRCDLLHFPPTFQCSPQPCQNHIPLNIALPPADYNGGDTQLPKS